MSNLPTPRSLEYSIPPSVNTPPTRRLGTFLLLELLGKGGMGEVYRARDSALDREVAVKVMRPELACDGDSRERFLREARAAAAVDHDHVVPIFQVGEDAGTPYIVMPLLAGETLERRLRREPMPPVAEVLRVGVEVALGLAAAHEKGLVHRDLKPANLWIEAPLGRVKILDFGLVRSPQSAAGLTRTGEMLGTPGYMSPEQIDGLPVDRRTDLFSLGCVLYRLATGQAAFEGETLSAVLRATAEREPAAAQSVQPHLPGGFSALIAELLAKRPADRPADAATVAQRLREIERQSRALTVVNRTRPKRRVSRRHWLLGGSLAALAVAGGIWRPWARHVPEPAAHAGPKEPLKAQLDVRVWKKADDSRGLALGDAGALPLAAGDWMRIEATASRPAYLYVIHLDSKGEASPLFPWRGYDWSDRRAEAPRSSLHLPEDPRTDGAPLDPGPSGIEAVLLLARETPLTASENDLLAKAISGAPKRAEFDPLRGAVWLGGDGDRFGSDRDRGRPNLDKAGTTADPVERVRRLLRSVGAELAEARRGVCYPFAGK